MVESVTYKTLMEEINKAKDSILTKLESMEKKYDKVIHNHDERLNDNELKTAIMKRDMRWVFGIITLLVLPVLKEVFEWILIQL